MGLLIGRLHGQSADSGFILGGADPARTPWPFIDTRRWIPPAASSARTLHVHSRRWDVTVDAAERAIVPHLTGAGARVGAPR
jgi:hypothetical protein